MMLENRLAIQTTKMNLRVKMHLRIIPGLIKHKESLAANK